MARRIQGLRPEHGAGEIDVKLMGRPVRANEVTLFTLIAKIDDLFHIRAAQTMKVAVAGIYRIEQGGERGAEVEAKPAAMADFEHFKKLTAKDLFVPEIFGLDVEFH